MDDNDGNDIVGSQIVPSGMSDNIVIHNTNITQLKRDYDALIDDDHVSSSGSMFQEITSESSNKTKTRKSSTEIIDNQIPYFPREPIGLPTFWYLYRINISNNNELGFIVPSEINQLPRFNIYENGDASIVQLAYVGSIDYQKCEHQLKIFCQYIFEEVFDDMNTGSKSILKFDLEHSTFKLLPCLLKESGDIDYERMISICNRKNKPVENLSKLNGQEVYIRLKSSDKNFYMNATSASLPKKVSHPRKDFRKVALKRIKKPSIDYLKKSSSMANQEPISPTTQLYYYPIRDLGYAPLNQTDFELIYKLPSILARIAQLYHRKPFIQLLANNIQSDSLPDIDPMSIVTFVDCLPNIFSSSQSNALPLDSLNYNLLLKDACEFQPSLDILFQSITRRSANEDTDMENLEILGDCFLKSAKSMSLYHEYPSDSVHELTLKRDKEVSNENLYQLAMKKKLKDYLYYNSIHFEGALANWLPPGYKIDEEKSDKYFKQKSDQDAFADMIEALIAAFLISTNYSTTLKLMNWLGLGVIPIDKHDDIVKIPSVLRINQATDMNEIENSIQETYNERSFIEIETKINYHFKDKAYLIAAFTHSSCSRTAKTIDYRRLKFIGNPLLEFLITRYSFLKKKEGTITPHVITNIRKNSLNNKRKADIMEANDLQTKMISIDKNRNQWADVFEALLGAIFLDSNYSLKIVWDVMDRLVGKCFELDELIENPTRNPEESVHEDGGRCTFEPKDGNDNFVCHVAFQDGTIYDGCGKSKRLAKEDACKKVKKKPITVTSKFCQ